MRARRKRRGAPTSSDERAAGPNLVLGLALAIARLHTAKCAAAYRKSDEEASSAWQADPEFGNALHLAYQMGETKPLRDFVKAGKSVPQAHVCVPGTSISMRVLVADLLGDHHQQQEQRNGKDALVGYLRFLAVYHPPTFAGLLGRVMPLHVNVKTNPQVEVSYPTLEEARQALRERGFDPEVIEAARLPKFLEHPKDE